MRNIVMRNCNIFQEVGSSFIVIAALYFQLRCSVGMRHQELQHIRRQWDPGIMQLRVMQWIGCECKCCNGSYPWTRCYDVVCKQFLNTTACGQAVFQGGGNVMPWQCHVLCYWAHQLSSSSAQITTREPAQVSSPLYKSEAAARHQEGTEKKEENRKGKGRCLPPPVQRSSVFPVILLTCRFDLAGGYGLLHLLTQTERSSRRRDGIQSRAWLGLEDPDPFRTRCK
ncbi:hypothetical protein SEVIR_7G025152v4 [Setaria viridis]